MPLSKKEQYGEANKEAERLHNEHLYLKSQLEQRIARGDSEGYFAGKEIRALERAIENKKDEWDKEHQRKGKLLAEYREEEKAKEAATKEAAAKEAAAKEAARLEEINKRKQDFEYANILAANKEAIEYASPAAREAYFKGINSLPANSSEMAKNNAGMNAFNLLPESEKTSFKTYYSHAKSSLDSRSPDSDPSQVARTAMQNLKRDTDKILAEKKLSEDKKRIASEAAAKEAARLAAIIPPAMPAPIRAPQPRTATPIPTRAPEVVLATAPAPTPAPPAAPTRGRSAIRSIANTEAGDIARAMTARAASPPRAVDSQIARQEGLLRQETSRPHGENILGETTPNVTSFVNSSGQREEVSELPALAELRGRAVAAKELANRGTQPFPEPIVAELSPAQREAEELINAWLDERKNLTDEDRAAGEWMNEIGDQPQEGRDVANKAISPITEEEITALSDTYAPQIIARNLEEARRAFNEKEEDIARKEEAQLGRFSLRNASNSSGSVNERNRNREMKERRLRDFERLMEDSKLKSQSTSRAEALGRAIHQKEMQLRGASELKDIQNAEFLRGKNVMDMRNDRKERRSTREREFLNHRQVLGEQETARAQALLNQRALNHAAAQEAPFQNLARTEAPIRQYVEALGLHTGNMNATPISAPPVAPLPVTAETTGTNMLGTLMQAGGALMRHGESVDNARRAQELHDANLENLRAKTQQIQNSHNRGRTE